VPRTVEPVIIAHMLDNLGAIAVEFATGGSIDIRLSREEQDARLTVCNDGPLLPPEIADRLFDSMVSSRPERAANEPPEPHLGLGRYSVRSVAEFHCDHARGANRPHGSGVEFRITLPVPG